ncbi:PREDICTED: uncharacterized protein LOC109581342 [Amphimedon queenslandica]|uniref:Palmitoyl-protein thioesterase 1 n=2 Tax=Amphimedon queenslandica TaxID=400682 RepID=A0AAN0J2J3_AMPQE|nr:PREDICTED: uncharacterized protein LOC109581342 [Amphimedon queenslandica]|eukprot:XP_019850953.1 PREDICTED: uncharacterized protein LOC109581342 [Amphimedon queenslandica]
MHIMQRSYHGSPTHACKLHPSPLQINEIMYSLLSLLSSLSLLLFLPWTNGVEGQSKESLEEEEEDLVPLVIWPGMGDSCCYVFGAAGYKGVIERMLPGLYVKIISFGQTAQEDSYNSFFLNSNKQVELACDLLSSDEMLANGFNAMGFSQGSQFLRALIQRCGRIKVYNLISVAGQHQGVYGFPFCLGETSWFCDLFRQFLSIGVYLTIFQDNIVQASYWHDPHDEESYQLDSLFLSDINQEVVFNPAYKERLSSISNFLLIKFETDMMVQPRETQWFGFYKPGQAVETYSLFESRIFTKDLLGLQYLNGSGRLHFLSSPNGHTLLTYEWLDSYILPFVNTTFSKSHLPVNISPHSTSTSTYSSIKSTTNSNKVITNVQRPTSIHVTSDGHVFVLSRHDNAIHRFDSNGEPLGHLGPLPNKRELRGIAAYDNTLYAVDEESNIHAYAMNDGQYTGIIYRTMGGSNSTSLQCISIDNDGLIYISESRESIHVISRDGSSLKNLSNIGTHPHKIVFDSDGHIRFTNEKDKSIYVLSKTGRLLHKYPTHLSYPSGLFVDSNDNMMVADREGGVRVFNEKGFHIHDIGGFEGCEDMKVSASGAELWVSDTKADRIYMFKL